MAPDCGGRCGVEMLGMSAAHSWRVRLRVRAWHACYDVDPSAFDYAIAHGFVGLKAAPCRL
jgi:hypothetical protein